MLVELIEQSGTLGRVGDRGARTYTRRFVGKSDNGRDDPFLILSDRRVPQQGERDGGVSGNRNFIVTDVEAVKRRPGNLLWDITSQSTDAAQDVDPNPLNQPAAIEWFPEQYMRRALTDNRGRVMLTKARSLYPQEVEDSRWVINVTKNLARPPRYLLDYNNAVNSDAVSIDGIRFKKKKLMCKGLRIPPVQTAVVNGRPITFRPVSFQVHYRPEGWKLKPPNVDLWELHHVYEFIREDRPGLSHFLQRFRRDADGNVEFREVEKRVRIQENGRPISDPVPIDRDGLRIPDADVSPSSIVFLEFDVYSEKPFRRLPLV